MKKLRTLLLTNAICVLLPLRPQAQSSADTISEAVQFWKLAPRINADLVMGDSCQVRLKRERDARMSAEKARMDAEFKATAARILGEQQAEHWKVKYNSANSERWVWRIVGFLGVTTGTILVLKPP